MKKKKVHFVFFSGEATLCGRSYWKTYTTPCPDLRMITCKTCKKILKWIKEP